MKTMTKPFLLARKVSQSTLHLLVTAWLPGLGDLDKVIPMLEALLMITRKVRKPLVANKSVFKLFLTEKYFRQCTELNLTIFKKHFRQYTELNPTILKIFHM